MSAGASNMQLKWPRVADAQGYCIFRKVHKLQGQRTPRLDQHTSWTRVTQEPITANSITISDLNPQHTYKFKVQVLTSKTSFKSAPEYLMPDLITNPRSSYRRASICEMLKDEIPPPPQNGTHNYTFLNGSVYTGEWRDGKRHGHGIMHKGGNVYDGCFHNDLMHGMGTYTWWNGQLYQGQWENGFRNGHGVQTWPSGQQYIGNWVDGKRHGQGAQYSKSGAVLFEGKWKMDKCCRAGARPRAPWPRGHSS